jgi:catechol 2,3-dioxygenase-like lactoylglutathione lyase family enzyme
MIMLGVRDLEKSVSFYRDRLGIDIRQRIPGFAFLASGALTIVLSEPLAKNVSPLAGATE